MSACASCGRPEASRTIGLCAGCLRTRPLEELSLEAHRRARRSHRLPESVPERPGRMACRLCANGCRPENDEKGYCGLRKNSAGRMAPLYPIGNALAHYYYDPLPTNCCASWFCRGSREQGYNLAVFFYGCSFDCLFCQNHSHKDLEKAPLVTGEGVVAAALRPEVRCVCFFGGSPEPQLPFALRVSRRIIARSQGHKHICWEWNGSGQPGLVKRAAELSAASGGTVKFDLKTFHPNLSLALCGVDNRRTYENFSLLAGLYPKKDLLTATTLLVPYYIGSQEVGEIARFIAAQGRDIPYSLLAFHPDYLLADLPRTPRAQAEDCFQEARRHLSRVNIGNLHLL